MLQSINMLTYARKRFGIRVSQLMALMLIPERQFCLGISVMPLSIRLFVTTTNQQ